MSKGLGQLQKDVLAVLSEKGKWLYSWEILLAVCESRGIERSEALYVSTRRAVNTLAKRNLVRSGERQDGRYRPRDGGYDRLAVWLPDHAAPDRLLVPLESKAVQAKVAAYLQSPTDKTPMLWTAAQRSLVPQVESGDVTYTMLLQDVARQLTISRYELPKVQAAIRRAVLRMERAGEVQIKRTQRGNIGLIRPNL